VPRNARRSVPRKPPRRSAPRNVPRSVPRRSPALKRNAAANPRKLERPEPRRERNDQS